MSTFVDIPLAERDAYSPFSQELLTKYWDRDEALRERWVPVQTATGSGGPGDFLLATYRVYVPIWAHSLSVKLNGDRDEAAGAATSPTIYINVGGVGTGDFAWAPVPLVAEDHTVETPIGVAKGQEHDLQIRGSVTGVGCTINLNAVYGCWFSQ